MLKHKKHLQINKGFTLIELLVVISIIAVLSSIVILNVKIARAKSIDARKISDITQVRTAVELYRSDTNTMPRNYNCNGTYCPSGGGSQLAIEDTSNPTNPTTESGKAYNRSMQDLVDAHAIAAIPHSPGGAPYMYYNYGSGNSIGALFGTSLQAATPSSTGLPGSCRPWYLRGAGIIDFVINSPYPDQINSYPDSESAKNACTTQANPISAVCTYVAPGSLYTNGAWTYFYTTYGSLDGSYQFSVGGNSNVCSRTSNQDYCSCNPY